MKKYVLKDVMQVVINNLCENGKWGTAHVYRAAMNAFSAFNEQREQPLNRLSPGVLKKFEIYLRSRNCSWNTVSTYMKTLRAVYNYAVENRWARYVPRLFEHVYTGTRADKKKAMETFEMSRLVAGAENTETHPLSSETLCHTEQLFVLMFLLRGLPFVDLAYLRKKDLDGNVLSYRRQKTGRTLRVTLSPEAMLLLEKMSCKDRSSPYLFPILHSREGSEEAYREYQSALRKFNYQLSILRKARKIQSGLSSYSARHTWATTAYYCEIHPGIISEAMGHSSIRVTETYLKPFRDKKINEANQTVIDFIKNSIQPKG